jgi:hypothetical protein
MKNTLFFFASLTLLFSLAACHPQVDREDIERQEAIDKDDIHESDSFDGAYPVNSEDEVKNQ